MLPLARLLRFPQPSRPSVRPQFQTRAAVTRTPRYVHSASKPNISELLTTSEDENVWIKRRPLPTTTSVKYTIPTDPYLLADKFQRMEREGKVDDAVAIVMQTKTVCQSQVLWNLVIDAYAKKGRLSRALRASTEMRRRGFRPTQTTFTALLKACALCDGEKSLAMAESIYRSIEDANVEPSIIHVNTLLSVYQHKHKVQPILNIYNSLPANGPMAPTLTTYTILLSALRRELIMRIDELKNEPLEPSAQKGEKKIRVDRRSAHIKKNMRQVFDNLMLAWYSYADDAVRRIDSADADDTTPLHIDAHIVNIVLKSCHAVYGVNRALGRKGLKIADQVYGMDKSLHAGDSEGTAQPSTLKDNPTPLAARIRRSESRKPSESMSKFNTINIDTIDLVLELCKRDQEPTKAIRFWQSLEKHFAADLEPIQSNFTERIDKFRGQMPWNNKPTPKKD
ncbi:hypothetical protein GGI11_002709 [Coemansia sp. RSA 2049]|nr:hypothetical protein GGI11_002709 [Coemansia sp. RSA 2049]